VQLSKYNVEIARKSRKGRRKPQPKPRPKRNGSWIHQESKKAVGLIQLDQTLDLTARTQNQKAKAEPDRSNSLYKRLWTGSIHSSLSLLSPLLT
jgi:hypothetical protein